MSIAIIDHVGTKAGIDEYTGQLAAGLVHNGIACMVVSNFTVGVPGVKSYRYFAHHLNSSVQKGINFVVGFFRAAWRCRASGYRDVIVHLFSYSLKDVYALLLMKLFGLRTTVVVHDVENFAKPGTSRWSRFMLHGLSARIVVHNRFSLEQMLALNGRDLESKTKIIPHGNFHTLPSPEPDRAAARKMLGLEDGRFYLLFFGQIKTVKGLDILLDALKELPEQGHLVIAGKPWKDDFSRYEEQMLRLGIGDRIVQMVRFIENDERDRLFKACDLLVLPYRQIFQSGVQLMGMSYKIPVVASDLAPNRELITHGHNGWLFASGDAADLAAVIKDIIAQPQQMPIVAQQAWNDCVTERNWDLIAHSYANW